MTTDPLLLTQSLVRCPSVTPQEAGTLTLVAQFLSSRGFAIERLDYGGVGNLYARKGNTRPHLCFLGHTDVVPAGDASRWTVDPFAAEVHNDILYGRGVVDMKGAIGAYLSALDRYLQHSSLAQGSLSVLLTTDEEGPGTGGIQHVVETFKARGEKIDACLGGEPTNVKNVGDTFKVGRRGSLNAVLTVQGKAGHVAYPHLARNPFPVLVRYLDKLLNTPLDKGMASFDPSHMEITSLEGGNPTANVIPAQATARLNIRYNPLHTRGSLTAYLKESAGQIGLNHTWDIQGSGEAFLCEDENLKNVVQEAVISTLGHIPASSTSGGTSDARFMKDICPVIEFGLVSDTAHQTDEHVGVEEIYTLARVYEEIIKRFFENYR